MIDGWTVVLDVGKTHAKFALLDEIGTSVAGGQHINATTADAAHRQLDADDIERWLFRALRECGHRERVRRIIPVAHGAAAAILSSDRLLFPPMDYEAPVSASERAAYLPQRDPFGATGSPLLPDGLNLGMQLHVLESRHGPLPPDAVIVPWPQYWAWRLSGVAASEVTSLGCHTDLWRPHEGRFSELAERRGWAARFAPLRPARDVLGTITDEVAERTGLPAECEVLCGLHDSNAALLAARGHAAIGMHEATVLSTGTWFVALRTPGRGSDFDPALLPEHRDCLVNVDVDGNAVPSARFMGGRDAAIIRQAEFDSDSAEPDPELALAVLRVLLDGGMRVFPSLVPGVGPYPAATGEICALPDEPVARRVAASLYLALMADVALDLIGARDCLLIEGRYAQDILFTRLLASLRPQQQVLTGGSGADLAAGALRLVAPAFEPPGEPVPVAPLAIDLAAVIRDWRGRAEASLRLN